jgi:hypothetical protein
VQRWLDHFELTGSAAQADTGVLPGRDADHPAVGLAAGPPDRALDMEGSRLEAHGAAATKADRGNNHDPAAMRRWETAERS